MNRKEIFRNLKNELNAYPHAAFYIENEAEAQNLVNIVSKIDTYYRGLFSGVLAPYPYRFSTEEVMKNSYAYDEDYKRAKKYADFLGELVDDVKVKKTFSLIQSLENELQNIKTGLQNTKEGISEKFVKTFLELKYALGDLFVNVVGDGVEIVMTIIELVETLENKLSEMVYNAYKMPLHESKLPKISYERLPKFYKHSNLKEMLGDTFKTSVHNYYVLKLNLAKNPADFYFAIKGVHFPSEDYSSPDNYCYREVTEYYSKLVEKIFALIPYKEEHMQSKLPLKIMENIFEYSEVFSSRGVVDKEHAKPIYTSLLASEIGAFLTPAILRSPKANMEFRTPLSIEELSDNFEKNLSSLKQISSKISEEEKLTPIEKDIYSKLRILDKDLFTHDWTAEINKDYENAKFKELKRLAKNNDRYKDAEYILAVRKLQAKHLGMEYDEKLAGGIAKRKLLEK